MEGYDEEQTEYSLNTKLLADGSDFPVVPNGQARREHHKGESFLPPPHMMTAGAQEKVLAKGRTSNPSPPEDSYSLAGESSYMFTFLMWFMFVAHAGCMTYALTADWSLTEILVLQTPSDPTCPTGGDWDSSLSVCRMEMFTSTYQSNVNQFWDSDAKSTACLMVFAGLIQPILKALFYIVIYHVPLTQSRREQMIGHQEALAKFTISTFWIQAMLLTCFTVKFGLDSDTIHVNVEGDVKITVYAGLVVFLTTQILSIVVVSMLRLTHDAVWQKRVGPARAALEAQGKPRTSSQRWTLGSLGVLSLVGFAIVWNYSFVHFKYEGLLTQDGLFYSNNPLKTSLHDLAVGSYLSDPIPIDNYNYFCFYVNLVIVPIMVTLLGIASAATPDRMHGTRHGIAKAVQLLHPYSVPETLFISIVIFAPDVLTVSEWIFGGQSPCDEVAEHGGNCLIVKVG
mmetsp:Transcript_64232/g.177650  ORF Transcript_64232/g.177650 Transcript_64232/m.177650 type:complete len:454 (-) Transcript_64232:200-1561(-)